uniref:Putative ovule protein n=1 Tax=Solanum chacoense TaxID=4108 RepID=A0A0V0H7T7_SOLCH
MKSLKRFEYFSSLFGKYQHRQLNHENYHTSDSSPRTSSLRAVQRFFFLLFTLSITESDLVYHKGFVFLLILVDWIKNNS